MSGLGVYPPLRPTAFAARPGGHVKATRRGILVSLKAIALRASPLLSAAVLVLSGASSASGQCTGCEKPSFGPTSRVSATADTGPLAAADFNNDGLLDVAVAGSTTLSVYLGDGAGGLRLASTASLPAPANSIVAGDFNGDGKADLAIAWPGGGLFLPDAGEILVFFGDGAGGLSPPVRLSAGFHPTSVVAGDFNGDGHLDLASGSWASSGISVLLGDGQGGFAAAISIGTPGAPTRIAVGDINGDGLPDLAVAMSDGSVRFFLATGDGGLFRDGSSTWLDRIPSFDLILADVNGDGRLDAAVLTRYDKVALLLGRGDGTFEAPSFTTTVAAASNIGAGDFNSDGRLDLIVNNSLFLGDGFGDFFFASAFPGFIPSVAGDFDGDGLLDVASANNSGSISSLIVSLGAGDGSFLAPLEFPLTERPARAFSVDLNADGKPDVLSVNTSWNLTALLGNGTGGFGPPVTTTLPGSYDLVIGDFDEDGFPDVVIYGQEYPYGYYLSFLRGDGAGHFGPAVRMPAVGGFGLAAGDFNGDHHLDIALASYGPLTLFFGDGKGLFGPPRTSVSLPEPGALVATDLNKDGKLDLVLFGVNDGRILTLLGDGQGGFAVGFDQSENHPTAFLVADFNGDGFPDLATVRPFVLTVRLGNGTGGFASPGDIPRPTFVGQIVGADFDGDGKLDLAVGGSIFRGDGAGGFQATLDFGYYLPGTLIAAADFTGDGKPDLLGIEDARPALWLLPNTTCQARRLQLLSRLAACGTAGVPFAIQPVVRVVDDGGNLIACDTGQVTASIVPGTGTPGAMLGGTTAVAVSGGVASFGNLSINLPGRGYELRFTHPNAHVTTSLPLAQSMPAPVISGSEETCTVGSRLFDGGPGYDGYQWTLGGVVAGSARFVTIGPLAAGPHALRLTVKQNGCQATASVSIATATSPPAPAASNNGPVPFSGTLQLSATAVSGATYEWKGPNGFASALRNPTIPNATPAANGRYQVVARVGGCASEPAATDVIVLPAPACGGCSNASFTPALRALPVGDYLADVVVADFDLDGILDIATVRSGNQISLLRGNGRGGFAPAILSPLGFSAFSLAAADLNGDGFPDIVGRSGDGVLVALGGPSGTFGPATDYPIGFNTSAVAVGDVNHDGIPDLIVTIRTANTVSVLLGNGSGVFGSATTIGVGNSPSAVLVRDFNGDGNPDLLVANQGSNSLSLLRGDGSGGFGAPSSLPMPGSPFTLTLGDVVGSDGVPDLLVGFDNGQDQALAIFQGSPSGSFLLVRSFPLSLTAPAVLGDVNGDGHADLLTLGKDGLSVRLWHPPAGDPADVFFLPKAFFVGVTNSLLSAALGFSLGDLNGDGTVDVAVGIGPAGPGGSPVAQVLLLPGDGHGGFTEIPSLVAGVGESQVGQLVVRDLNHDGHPDLLVSIGSSPPNRVSVFLSDGHGGFLSPTNFTPPNSANLDSFVVGDVDGDGLADLVLLEHFAGRISVFPGNAAGAFQSPVVTTVGRSFSLLGSGDFNGDGRLDLLISDNAFSTSPGISVLPGTSASGFGSPIAISGFVQSGGLAVADFNHDGRADIVVSNAGLTSVSVYLGDGTGRFAPPVTTTLDTYPEGIVAADFTGDGNVDVVVLTFRGFGATPGNLSLLSGDGAGGFASRRNFSDSINMRSLFVVDFNGDGKPDIGAILLPGAVELFANDGLGGFAAPVQYVVGNSLGPPAAADLNGDGRIDLAVPDSFPAAVRFLFNSSCVPSHLGVTSSPACPSPAQVFPVQPVVRVFDDGDNVVACDSRAVTAGIVPGSGTPGAVLGGTTSVAAVNGVASFSNLSIDVAGTLYRLEFHHPLASPARTPPFSVGSLPSAPVASNNGPICAGQTLQLSASSVPGAIYRWTGPNGFKSGLRSPSVSNATPLASGTYSVTVTVNGCSSPPATTGATVISTPAPTASNNGPVCAGETLQLSASTVAGATYSWTGPGSFTSTDQNPQILSAPASASGQYRVTATANGCASPVATTSAVVRALPSAVISAPTSVCASSSGYSASVPSAGTGARYAWSIANGTITSGAQAAAMTFTAGPSGSVQLGVTVTNFFGCAGTDSRSVSIAEGPACGIRFFTVTPCRVADTREAEGPSGGPALEGGAVRSFPVASLCGIPPSAKAVAINLAVVAPDGDGDLRLYPDGQPAPLASSINFRSGIVRSNNAIIPLGPSGQISVQCDMPSGGTHFFLDVYGYFQ